MTVGLPYYLQRMYLLKIYGHLRYVFVRSRLLSLQKRPEEGFVVVRWQLLGIPTVRMAVLYIPKKLWRKDRLVEEAK